MVYVDGKVFYIYPYSEGHPSIYYFNQNDPTRKAGEFGGNGRCMQRAVTDGNRLYFMNTEHCRDGQTRTFLYAFELGTQQMYMFENGGQWYSSWGVDNVYYGVNMIEHARETFQTGDIAVQKNGNFLFNSYVAENKVYVLNKNNGSLLSSISLNQPRSLAYNDNNGLWIGYQKNSGRYTAQHYTVDKKGQLTPDNSVTLEHDFGYLLHLELSPDGTKLVVADGETNQFKMYNTKTGKLVWTYGSGESYEEDPTVYPDKLMLKHTANGTDLVYSEFEDNNTLWIGDQGNNRAYKLNIAGSKPVVIDELMTQPGSHSLGVDMTNPTTVYSNAVQYEMDYQKSGRDSWRVVKNWKKQAEAFGLDIVTFNQFNNFITLPNGKTYFSAFYDGGQKLFCLEDNYIRNTGMPFDNRIMMDEYTVGSILGGVVDDKKVAVYRAHDIIGYNESNDPILDEEGRILAILPDDWSEPTHVFGGMKLNMPITENNIMLTLRCQLQRDINDRKTYHIGGVKLGDEAATDWLWKASPEGSDYYDGNFPTDGTFEAGNGVWNSAQKIVADGKNIVFQYNGEFYRAWQTNKLYFYRDNGLLVGVFGEAANQRRPNDEWDRYGKEIFPGNAFDMYFIQDEEDTDRAYIMQNNESGFGNFKYNITGLDTIKEHTLTVNLKHALWDGLTYRYYVNGDSKDPASCMVKDWRSTVGRESYATSDNFAMRYTGYIMNPNGTGNLKLSINTKETLDLTIGTQQVFVGEGIATPEVYMEAGKLYPFNLEVKKNSSSTTGNTRVSLTYYDAKGKLQQFTERDFKTAGIPYENPDVVEVDLLEDLPFSSELKSGTYGITRGTPGNVDGVSVNTNSTNPSFDDVRDIRFGAALWPVENGMWPRSAWFAKNLGEPRENLQSWEIDMDVSRWGYINYGELGNPDASTGMHIDVLDVNDKVIARFYWAKENKTYGNNQFIYQATNLYHNNQTSEIYEVSNKYDNDFIDPSPLVIRGENGNVIFEYYGQETIAPVLDPDAQWDKPLKVKVDAFYNAQITNAREMNISITKFNYKQYLTN